MVDHMRSAGVDAEGLVLEGRPDELITAVAKERNADLIVTGSHGRTGLERILLGSTTERILNDTACAVLVVKS
ncbi:MAG: universal stress protein [Pseudomonadota bacterium]